MRCVDVFFGGNPPKDVPGRLMSSNKFPGRILEGGMNDTGKYFLTIVSRKGEERRCPESG
jgi:hypothetical protein